MSSQLPDEASSLPTVRQGAWLAWFKAFIPAPLHVDRRERLRGIAGALVGILFTAALSRWLASPVSTAGWLLAPLGASAVLVFAAPASPLAQPWSVVGGNTVSALIGMLCAAWLPDPVLAAAVAVSLAIGVMFALRCLHPPGGAMALSAVLLHASHGQLAVDVALVNSVLLVCAGLAYNALTGRAYPHAQAAPKPAAPQQVGGRFSSEDIDKVLARYNQVLDVSRDDLEALLYEAEMEGLRRRINETRCSDVMSRNVVSVDASTPLDDAWRIMRERGIKALPVVDRSRHIVGIVTMADFLRAAGLDERQGFGARLREVLRPEAAGAATASRAQFVGQIMSRQVRVASADRHAMELLPLFTEAGHHHIPVIDEHRRLVGIITQSDFVRALHRIER